MSREALRSRAGRPARHARRRVPAGAARRPRDKRRSSSGRRARRRPGRARPALPPWSSIDNDDSRDLDQIEVAEALPRRPRARARGHRRRRRAGAPRARRSTRTPRRTPAPSTPARGSSRCCRSRSPPISRRSAKEATGSPIVVEMDVDPARRRRPAPTSTRPRCRNHAKLAYDGVGAWLEGTRPAPPKVAASAALQEQLRLQDRAAQALKKLRHEHGALDLETIEARAVVKDGAVTGIELTKKSRARALIEDFMIAANGAMARFLDGARSGVPPPRGEGAGALAAHRRAGPAGGDALPAEPSSRALADVPRSTQAGGARHVRRPLARPSSS